MKFTIAAAKLAKACAKLKPLINDGRVSPILGCAVLSFADGFAFLRGGDGNQELTLPLGAANDDGALLLPFAPTYAFVQGCPDGAEVEIESTDNEAYQIILRSGRRRAKLGVPGSLDQYPPAGEGEYPSVALMPAPELAAMLARCLPFAYQGVGRDHIAGINLSRNGETLRALATDGLCIIRADMLAQFAGQHGGPRTIPSQCAAAIVAICKDAAGDAQLGIAENGFLIVTDGDDGQTRLRCPAIATEFPKIAGDYITDADPDAAPMPRKTTLGAVQRVGQIITTDDTRGIWLQIGDGELRIAGRADNATVEEFVDCPGALEFCQTSLMVTRMLNAFDGEYITATPNNKGAGWRIADPADQSIAVMLSGFKGAQAPERG